MNDARNAWLNKMYISHLISFTPLIYFHGKPLWPIFQIDFIWSFEVRKRCCAFANEKPHSKTRRCWQMSHTHTNIYICIRFLPCRKQKLDIIADDAYGFVFHSSVSDRVRFMFISVNRHRRIACNSIAWWCRPHVDHSIIIHSLTQSAQHLIATGEIPATRNQFNCNVIASNNIN